VLPSKVLEILYCATDCRFQEPLKHLTRLIKKEKNGCWNFTGCDVEGYGKIKIDGKQWRAHRLSWTLHVGDIPEGMDVLHKCVGNRACCNPEHLYLGTVRENARDRMDQGRQHDRSGEKCPTHKLTERDVIEIRSRRWTARAAELASQYNVGKQTIWQVWLSINWKHLPPSPPKPVDIHKAQG
jgi:hypothetical protein